MPGLVLDITVSLSQVAMSDMTLLYSFTSITLSLENTVLYVVRGTLCYQKP